MLDPYIQQGIVDLDNATDSVLDENGTVVHHAQLLTFSRAVAKHQNETLWMAFIDIDEFLFAVGPITLVGSDGSSMELEDPSLRDVLPAYAEFGGVVVHWVMYGSSGYEETPLGLVIENYLWRAAEISPLFKSIAQPRRLVKCNNHNHEFQPGFFAVTEDNEIVPHNTSQNHPATVSPTHMFPIATFLLEKTQMPHKPRSPQHEVQDKPMRGATPTKTKTNRAG